MRVFRFERDKYGFELLMDLHRFQENPQLEFDPNPQTIDFFEIMLFERGQGAFEINGHYQEVAPRTVSFSAPWQVKRLGVVETTARGFHLVFQSEFLADFFADKLFVYRLQYFYPTDSPQVLFLAAEEYPLIEGALWEITHEIGNYRSDSNHIIRSLLYFVLTKLNRLYAAAYQLNPETQQFTEAYRFKAALETHIRQWHRINEYAALLQIDRGRLNRVVKDHFGYPPGHLIQRRLLQEITSELRYTEKTVAEISFDLGFSEPNNLSRFFRQQTGTSPTAYRQNVQSDRNH